LTDTIFKKTVELYNHRVYRGHCKTMQKCKKTICKEEFSCVTCVTSFSFSVASLLANSVSNLQPAIFAIKGYQRSPWAPHMTMCQYGAPGMDWNQNGEELLVLGLVEKREARGKRGRCWNKDVVRGEVRSVHVLDIKVEVGVEIPGFSCKLQRTLSPACVVSA